MKSRKLNTKAFKRFQLVINRTNRLLEVAVNGIAGELTKSESLLNKFSGVKVLKGRFPKDYEPQIKMERNTNDATVKMAIDERSVALIKKALKIAQKSTDELKFHHNSIMLVYLWSSLETYLYMLFEELFLKRPEMLKSSEVISYKTAIENEKNIIEYLVQNELDRIGHFSLEEYLKYLDKKINVIFQKNIQERLKKIYLIRNIVAHNTGIISPRLEAKLPNSVKVINSELHISTSFIQSEIKFIETIVSKIENHVIEKFK